MRLQKYLAECGVASRRKAEALIAEGRVTVNGEPAIPGVSVDSADDRVCLDGHPVEPDEKVYIVLHKPEGVVTSAEDTHRRRTVIDCVRGARGRVFPVGRLDMDVSGTLLLTNDGELAYRMTHPKYQVDKEYLAWVKGVMSRETAKKLSRGVELDDGPTAPADVTVIKTSAHSALVRLVIHEGRNRQVKRMCADVGHPVRSLRRVSVASIRVHGLIPGEWRYLDPGEITGLRQGIGLPA